MCCRIFVLEQGNSSLSQSVTVYPALPRQPAGDLLAMVRIMMVMTMIMMTFTKKTAGDLLATVRMMMMTIMIVMTMIMMTFRIKNN